MSDRHVYWVSTPRFTVSVEVDADGVIRRTAPYLRHAFTGKPWGALQVALVATWGNAVQVADLGTLKTSLEEPP